MKKAFHFTGCWPLLLFMLLAVSGLSGCGGPSSSPPKADAPAKVENPVPESQLTTVVLTPQAEKRLGIQTALVQSKTLSQSISLHGEILAVPGFTVAVSAPFTGKLLGASLTAGHIVRKGQTVFDLVALPNDTSGLGAQQEVLVRRQQMEAAQAQVSRYEQLQQSQAASERLLQESRVALTNAQAALKAAQSRQRFLNDKITRSDMPQLSRMSLKAPLAGVIQKIFVTSDQVVAGGTPLFEIGSLNPVWVRVPVYSGDLASINNSQKVTVQPLGESTGSAARTAHFVSGPPPANPQAISTDVFYEFPNQDNAFQIGQRVSVTLNRKGSQSGLTLPYSAIVYDVDGGTWIYQWTAPHAYARKRVLVSRVVGKDAVLAKPIEAGSKIVTVGAAELFGTEFGAGK